MKWIDVNDIAIELVDLYPEVDPFTLNFVDLREKILQLPDFNDDKNGCNEKILEAIQMAWSQERD